MKLTQKQIINFSIFVAACSLALYYMVSQLRQQRAWDATLPEGRDNFTFLYGQLTNQTKVIILGEYHDSRQIALKFAFNLISSLLYNITTANDTFLHSTHPINIYFEETVSNAPVKNRERLCQKNQSKTASLCRLSKNVTSWDKYELHSAYATLMDTARSMRIWDAVISFQQLNELGDTAMYELLRSPSHPGFSALFESIMNIVERVNISNIEVIIRNSLKYLFTFGETMPLTIVVLKLFAIAAQYNANIALRAGEDVNSLIDRMFSSQRARNISISRNDYLFDLMNNASLQHHPSFFLAGNFHAVEMRDRLLKDPNPRVAIISMKELSGLHRVAKRQVQLHKNALA